MKTIVWVVNIPFGKMNLLLEKKVKFSSGGWLDIYASAFYKCHEYKIVIVTTWNVKHKKILIDNNITYVILPGGSGSTYSIKSNNNNKHWKALFKEFKPDLVQIWGTEFRHALVALKNVDDVPKLLYVQGIIKSIHKYYFGGMTFFEILKCITIRDILKIDMIWIAHLKIKRQIKIEAEIIDKAKNLIVENTWARSVITQINANSNFYQAKLPVNQCFRSLRWDLKNCQKNTVFTVAGVVPYKGLHNLLKALKIVVARNPNVKLILPGIVPKCRLTHTQRLKLPGYLSYLYNLVEGYNLTQHVDFIGVLTHQEMAYQMSIANLFVMPSAIENHSSTLIEAQSIGLPCVAADVGGVSQIIQNNLNGILYRYEDIELLAKHIIDILENDALAINLSEKTYGKVVGRDSLSAAEDLKMIYNDLIV